MTNLHELHDTGQSTWLNYMRRAFIRSGGLRTAITKGIQGVTANAAIFEDTILNDTDYDQDIRAQVMAGTPTTRIHEALMVDDVQRAADMLHPIFEESGGLDGVASLEIDPALAYDSVSTVATVRRLLARVDRGNAMMEIPATQAGAAAVQALTADGINVNATHIFSISAFERFAQAYICGLETYFDTHSVWRTEPTSVASFSVSPIDRVVDEILLARGRPDLQGQTAVAVARLLYARYLDIFSGPRWDALEAREARPLRPKWTRLEAPASGKATRYMDALIGPDTVMTFTPETLDHFLAHGHVALTLPYDLEAAEEHVAELLFLDIDLEAFAAELQQAHLEASDRQYQALIGSVVHKLVTEAPGYR
jgi:transaldolase